MKDRILNVLNDLGESARAALEAIAKEEGIDLKALREMVDGSDNIFAEDGLGIVEMICYARCQAEDAASEEFGMVQGGLELLIGDLDDTELQVVKALGAIASADGQQRQDAIAEMIVSQDGEALEFVAGIANDESDPDLQAAAIEVLFALRTPDTEGEQTEE